LGSLICHAGVQSLAVLALAIGMITTPFGTQTLLITAIGFLTLQTTGFSPAAAAAIPLAAIAVAADVKHSTAGRIVTSELVKKDGGTGSRHGLREGALDSLRRSCQDGSRCVGELL
jgi:hypothetical protein